MKVCFRAMLERMGAEPQPSTYKRTIPIDIAKNIDESVAKRFGGCEEGGMPMRRRIRGRRFPPLEWRAREAVVRLVEGRRESMVVSAWANWAGLSQRVMAMSSQQCSRSCRI